MTTALLKDWHFVRSGRHTSISGRVYGDKKDRWADGALIITSLITRVDFNNAVAYTRLSSYQLDHESMMKAQPFRETIPFPVMEEPL